MPTLRLVTDESPPTPAAIATLEQLPSWWIGRARMRFDEATAAIQRGQTAIAGHHLTLVQLYLSMAAQQLEAM